MGAHAPVGLSFHTTNFGLLLLIPSAENPALCWGRFWPHAPCACAVPPEWKTLSAGEFDWGGTSVKRYAGVLR